MRAPLAILLILASSSLCAIGPGHGLADATILSTDLYSQDLSHVFDLSKAKYPLKSSTTNGRIYGDGVPFQSKNFAAFGVEKLYLVKWITHNVAAFVFDKHKVIIQIIDGNGKVFLRSLFHDFNILTNLYCTGFEYNDLRNLVYIGCFGPATQSGPGKLLIATYDISLQDVTSELTLDQKDGFDIKNQLELRIVKAPQNSNEEVYLIAYDQGHGQHYSSRHNSQFRVFRNVAYRQLTYYYLGNIDAYDHDNSILYDIYTYQGTIITSGRVESDTQHITLAQCRLDNASRALVCGNIKETLVQEGNVSIHNESVLITVDLKTRRITAYQLQGEYKQIDWAANQIHLVTSADLIDTQDVWVSGLTYSQYGAAITWTTHKYAEEFGTTFVNWNLNYSHSQPGMFGFVWEKSFVYGDAQTGTAFLLRNVISELLVSQANLQDGDNQVTVTMSDKEGEQTSTATITLLDDLMKNVSWNTIADSQVTAGQSGVLPIDNKSIKSGNGLSVSAKSLNTDVLTIDKAFYGAMVAIDFEGITDLTGNFYFDGNAAVVENNRKLSFQTCTQDGPGKNVSCKALGSYSLKSGDVTGEKILSLTNGVVLAWVTNFSNNRTTLLAASENGLHAFVHPGIVLDIAKYLKATASLDYIAVAEDNAVVVLAVNINDSTEWQVITTLTATNFDETDFCPVEIRSQKLTAHPWGWFIILSNCNNGKNYSQEIFTWAVTKDTPTPALPLSSFDSPRNICAFMREILVVTHERIYGVSIADDLNYWSVPLSTFNIDIDRSQIFCLESQNLAVFVGYVKGSNQRGTVFIRGNSGYRQDRRYPHILEGLSSDRIHAHDFLGSILISAEEFGEIGFVQTYIDPVVAFTTKSVQADTVVDIEVTVQNASASAKFTTHVTVKKATGEEVPTLAAE